MTLSLLNKILLDEIYAQELFFPRLPAEVVQIVLVFWNDCDAESHDLGTCLKDQQNQVAITKHPSEYQEGEGTVVW